jgi:hypothetical protein
MQSEKKDFLCDWLSPYCEKFGICIKVVLCSSYKEVARAIKEIPKMSAYSKNSDSILVLYPLSSSEQNYISSSQLVWFFSSASFLQNWKIGY